MTTKKPTAKQLAARKLFAERVKAGAFKTRERKANPAKAKNAATGYRGKYPKKIHTIHGVKGDKTAMVVILNDGTKIRVSGKETGGVMPKLGHYLNEYLVSERMANPVRKTIKKSVWRVLTKNANGEFEEIAIFNKEAQAFEYARSFADKYDRVTAIHHIPNHVSKKR